MYFSLDFLTTQFIYVVLQFPPLGCPRTILRSEEIKTSYSQVWSGKLRPVTGAPRVLENST